MIVEHQDGLRAFGAYEHEEGAHDNLQLQMSIMANLSQSRPLEPIVPKISSNSFNNLIQINMQPVEGLQMNMSIEKSKFRKYQRLKENN